jgi:putative (di)nucleoside polyphosphate hydrolase
MLRSVGQHFRAGVGAVIGDGRGRVLAGERADVPGAWQLPQGGLEKGEEPETGLWREVQEETGLHPEHLRLVTALDAPLAYELPPELRRKKTGRGQVLYWFFLELAAGAPEPALPKRGEFRSWRWMPLAELAEQVAAFRRATYQRLVSAAPPAWSPPGTH